MRSHRYEDPSEEEYEEAYERTEEDEWPAEPPGVYLDELPSHSQTDPDDGFQSDEEYEADRAREFAEEAPGGGGGSYAPSPTPYQPEPEYYSPETIVPNVPIKAWVDPARAFSRVKVPVSRGPVAKTSLARPSNALQAMVTRSFKSTAQKAVAKKGSRDHRLSKTARRK